jgi:hypothetical protein
VKRREQQQEHEKNMLVKKKKRKSASITFKKRQALEDEFFSPRKCLLNLLKINLCCGIGQNVSQLDDDDIEVPSRVPIFTAEDIFNARSNVIDSKNVSSFLRKEISLRGHDGFIINHNQVCDVCWCDMHNVKVTFFICATYARYVLDVC